MGIFRDFLHRLFGKDPPSLGTQEGEGGQSPSFIDWSQADHIIVEMTIPNESSYGRIELQSKPPHDARINFESRTDKETQKGIILVVSGGWMATKDLTLEQGFEIDTVDGAFIQIHLVLALLHRAFPTGPTSVRGEENVNIEEKDAPIQVGVGAAFAIYEVPWSLRGIVRREQTGFIEYDLLFTFLPSALNTGKVSHMVRRLTGMVEKLQEPFGLPDSFPLQDWRVFRHGPSFENSSLDYVARPAETLFCTVGELRKATQH